jgi:hypothetical protein
VCLQRAALRGDQALEGGASSARGGEVGLSRWFVMVP